MKSLIASIEKFLLSNPFEPSIQDKFFDKYKSSIKAQPKRYSIKSVYTFSSRPLKPGVRG